VAGPPVAVRAGLGAGPRPADVTVRDRAADLLLVLTRRAAPAGRVEVDGDEGLFAHWLDHSRF
jgi:hypothetical protein